jgi:hypothetical protein
MHCEKCCSEHRMEQLTGARGAHGSKGRTSWSGRPELDDYTSFAAFFIHYLCYLRPYPASDARFAPENSPMLQVNHPEQPACRQTTKSPIVILGGYSYGSLILKHLPPISTILYPFSSPILGSARDEILLRAHKLADQSNLTWINLARCQEREKRLRERGREPKQSVTMGGEETTPEKRRTSRDIRRSVDRGLNVELGNRLRSLSHCRRKDGSPVTSLEKTDTVPITAPEVRYLLVSPLTPPISTFVAPALGHKFWSKSRGESDDVIGKHATLAIYGNQDIFTSAKRIRDWSEQLKAATGSLFSSVEVAEAGHFWVECGVEEKLRAALREWEAGIQ